MSGSLVFFQKIINHFFKKNGTHIETVFLYLCHFCFVLYQNDLVYKKYQFLQYQKMQHVKIYLVWF